MTNISVKLIVLIGGMFVGPIGASPTPNEFVPCKKRAVASLEYCLNDGDKNCWSKSKASYESCHKDVMQRHSIKNTQIKKAKIESVTHKRK